MIRLPNNASRMLLALAAFLTIIQRLDPAPRVSYPGDVVVVRAVSPAGQPVPGIEVRVRIPSGATQVVGAANEKGEVAFAPSEVGSYEFRASFPDGPLVIAVYDIVPRPMRWLYALILTPIGLWLMWWNFKKLRRTEQD